MFLKKIIFSKKSLFSIILSGIIPFIDPYYNLNVLGHVVLTFKIWFALLIIFSIKVYIFNKIFK